MNNELIPFNEDENRIKETYYQRMKDIIREGVKVMPLLARSNHASGFCQMMVQKLSPYDSLEAQDKWKEEYAIGFLKIAFTEIYDEIQLMPQSMRGYLARQSLEQHIMPGVQKEIQEQFRSMNYMMADLQQMTSECVAEMGDALQESKAEQLPACQKCHGTGFIKGVYVAKKPCPECNQGV